MHKSVPVVASMRVLIHRISQQLLQLLVKMNDAVCKVETLTASLEESSHAETKSSTAGTDGTRSARLKLIERIAIELHQLYFLLGKEQNVAFARTLQGVCR